ncbi:MAG: hypothetical protein QOI59_2997 [Gammaproteobacteria bacterium]|nr:hypothetical protein [Gammaproteobacteria bacterium]
MVLDVDPDAIPGGIRIQRNRGSLLRELESILQQVSHRRKKHVPVHNNSQFRIDFADVELTFAGLCLEHRGDTDIGDEVGERNQQVARRHSRGDPHVGEGAIDEIPQSYQRLIEDSSRSARQPYVAGLDGHKGQSGCVNEISQLVGQKSQSFIQGFDAIILHQGVALKRILGDGIGDSVVQTAVESSKFVNFYQRGTLKCEIGYRLAQIAVVVNNLVHREPSLRELAPMERRSDCNLRQNRTAACWTGDPSTLHRLRRLLHLERLYELIEETRYSVYQLGVGRFGGHPLSDFEPAPIDQIVPVCS